MVVRVSKNNTFGSPRICRGYRNMLNVVSPETTRLPVIVALMPGRVATSPVLLYYVYSFDFQEHFTNYS